MTTSKILRAATAADADDIARVWHRGWHDGHVGHVPDAILAHRSLDAFRDRVPARIAIATVAMIDARLAGFIMVHDDEVEQIYVAADARGSGIAVALLEHGERAIAARFDVAWLAVVEGNVRACRFYARHGWSDAGAIDYQAQIAGGTFAVPSRRYEKRLGARSAGP